MDEIKQNVITFKSGYDDSEITLKLPADSDIYDDVNIFRTLLIFATFAPETIKNILKDEDEEETQNYN